MELKGDSGQGPKRQFGGHGPGRRGLTLLQQCRRNGATILVLGWTEGGEWRYLPLELSALQPTQREHLKTRCLKRTPGQLEAMFGVSSVRTGLRGAVDAILRE